MRRTFVILKDLQMLSTSPRSEAHKEINSIAHEMTLQDGNKYSSAVLGKIVPMITTVLFFSVRNKIIALRQFDLNLLPGHQDPMLSGF